MGVAGVGVYLALLSVMFAVFEALHIHDPFFMLAMVLGVSFVFLPVAAAH